MREGGIRVKILLINASPNKQGMTVKWGERVLAGIHHEKVHLVDFAVDQLGQVTGEDDFWEIMGKVSEADCVVIGTPIYWWDISGLLKTFIDRWTDLFQVGLEGTEAPLYRLPVYWIVQGANINESIDSIKKMLENVSERFLIENKGVIYQKQQIQQMNKLIKNLPHRERS